MGLGAGKPKQLQEVSGHAEARTTVYEQKKGQGRVKVKEFVEQGAEGIGPKTFDAPYSMVGARTSVTQAIHYQSIVTEVSIVRPCRADPRAEADAMAANWVFINEQLDMRAEWATHMLKGLVDIKLETEGK